MSKKLQVEVDLDLFGDSKPEVAVTPVNLVISDAAGDALRQAIQLAELGQAGADPNELDVKDHIAIPVHISFIKTNVNVSAIFRIRVKDI